MIARYEKLDEYIEAIKEEAAKDKDQPIYISILRTQDEENILTSQIYIQVISYGNNNLVLTHCYTDLPAIKVVQPSAFDSVFGTTETSVAAKKQYEAEVLTTVNNILAEKTKIINKLKELGFKKFINANLQ